MVERSIVMAVAGYTSMAAAARDFTALCEPMLGSRASQIAAALVQKGATGQLAIIGHRCTTGDAGFGRVFLGAALVVIAAPLGVDFLPADERSGAERTRLGALVSHFWHNVGKADLRSMSDLLEATQSALVIVSVGARRKDVAMLASNAATAIVTESDASDAELWMSVENASTARSDRMTVP